MVISSKVKVTRSVHRATCKEADRLSGPEGSRPKLNMSQGVEGRTCEAIPSERNVEMSPPSSETQGRAFEGRGSARERSDGPEL